MKQWLLSIGLLFMLSLAQAQEASSWLVIGEIDVFHQNLPLNLQNKLRTIQQRGNARLQAGAFGPIGGSWVLSYYSGELGGWASHNHSWEDFPRACIDKIAQIQKDNSLIRHIWADDRAWLVLYDGSDLVQSGLPAELLNQYAQAYRNQEKILDIALVPMVDDAWILLTDKQVLYRNIPFELLDQIKGLQAEKAVFQQIVFEPSGKGWFILYNGNQFMGLNLPNGMEQAFDRLRETNQKALRVIWGR
jgi:hypothetical protein